MRNIFKAAAVVSAVSLMIGTFSACDFGNFEKEKTTTKPTSQSTTQASVEKTTEQTTSEQTTTEKTETDSLETILFLISRFPAGTAGSSVKGADLALRLINFAQFSEYSEAEIKRDFEHFIAKLENNQKAVFYSNLEEINYFALELIKGENQTIINYLSAPGDYRKNEYSLEKYEEFFDEISKT